MTHDEMIAVLQAAKAGKAIQYQYNCGDRTQWSHATERMGFDFVKYTYRVKPEPKVIWVNEYKDGVVAYTSEHLAKDVAQPFVIRAAVKFIEVIDTP